MDISSGIDKQINYTSVAFLAGSKYWSKPTLQKAEGVTAVNLWSGSIIAIHLPGFDGWHLLPTPKVS